MTTARRVLVTGAAGFIGRPLVDVLEGAGHDVVGLDLQPARGRTIRGRIIRGDVRQLPSDLPATDVVVHLAGLAGDGAADELLLHDVNAGGTAAVVDHARRTGATRVVLVSSIAALGPSELPLDERAPARPVTAYGRSKAAAEVAARRHAGSVELCTMRPGYVFGPGHSGNFGRMLSAIGRGRFALPGRADTLKAGIALSDVAELLLHLVSAPAVPEVVHAVYPDTPTIAEVCRLLANACDAPEVRVVPDPLVRPGLAVLRRVARVVPAAGDLVDRVDKLRQSSNVVSRELGVSVPAPRLDWPSALAAVAAAPTTRLAGV